MFNVLPEEAGVGPGNDLLDAFRDELGANRVRGDEAFSLLTRWQVATELAIADRIRGHSAAFWYAIIRRSPIRTFGAEMESTGPLARRIASRAAAKYGAQHDWLVSGDFEDIDGVYYSRPTNQDLVAAVEIEHLSTIASLLRAAQRRIGKGGVLYRDGDGFVTDLHPTVQALVEKLDRRWEQNEDFVGQMGGLNLTRSPSPPSATEDLRNQVVSVARNEGRDPLPAAYAELLGYDEARAPNFIPVFLNIDGARRLAVEFEPHLTTQLGVSPVDVLDLLVGWTVYETRGWHLRGGNVRSYFESGYRLLSDDFVENEMLPFITAIVAHLRSVEPEAVDMRTAWGWLSQHGSEEIASRSVDFPTHPLPIIAGAGFVLVDLACMHSAVDYVCRPLARSKGVHGDNKGRVFEEAVRDAFARHDMPVLADGMLTAADGLEEEVDAVVALDETTALVIECKGRAASDEVMLGEFAATRNRWTKFKESVRQAERKATFLTANPTGPTYDLSQFDTFVPVVCSSGREWIADADARYWIDDETPRILTTSELIKYVHGTDTA